MDTYWNNNKFSSISLIIFNPSAFLQGILINIWCIVTYLLWSITYTLMDVPFGR